MSVVIKNWTLLLKTPEDKKYMEQLFSFVLHFFSEIFGENEMNAESCVVFNDSTANYPMLITNTTPISMRTNVEDLNYWAQFIYHLSHEMTHYIIRQYKNDKTVIIKWFEETICEAMSLYILLIAGQRWKECELFESDRQYGESLESYWNKEYQKTAESVLKKCRTMRDLELVENTCETNRIERSIERNYLFDTFCKMPDSISEFVYYPLYMRGDLQIDFEKWKSTRGSNLLLSHLKEIQPILAS